MDRVSGLPIPFAPGDYFYRTKDGCGVITDEWNWSYRDYSTIRWVGACTFGVINGPGYLIEEDPQFATSYRQLVRAELGYVRPHTYEGSAFLPRASARDRWERLTIVRDPGSVAVSGENLFKPTGEVGWSKLVEHVYETSSTFGVDTLQIDKKHCPNWTDNKKTIEYVLGSDGLNASQQKILIPYCQASIRRFWNERGTPVDFSKVDYGFFFVTMLSRLTRPVGTQNNSLTRTVWLCPNLSSLAGCDSVWRTPQAPYLPKFDDMKSQQEAMFATRFAEAKQRFAPLQAAWLAKVAKSRDGG